MRARRDLTEKHLRMSDLNDPNVIYGGDIHLELIEKFKSLGSLIINNLTLGGDKVVLVSNSFLLSCFKHS